MKKTALFGVILVFIVPLLAFLIMEMVRKDEMPQRLFYEDVQEKVVKGKKVSDTIWSKVPDFTFTNQLGKKVSLSDLKGKVIVADFIFTRCPVVCPKMTRNMKRLQDAVRSNSRAGNREANFVHFISFTVDPKHDSVEVLKQYADRNQINPNNWWLLTGDKKEIYDLALNSMRLGINDTEVDTAFIHPQKFVLIDRDRVIRARKDEFGNPDLYDGLDSADVKNIAEDIVLLTLEKDPNKKFVLANKIPFVGIIFCFVIIGVSTLVYFLKRKQQV